MMNMLMNIWNCHFGRLRLKRRYLQGWRWTVGTLAAILLLILMVVLLQWWCDRVVPVLNYLIWG